MEKVMAISPKEAGIVLKEETDMSHWEDYIDDHLLKREYEIGHSIVAIEVPEAVYSYNLRTSIHLLAEKYKKAGWRNVDVYSDFEHTWIRLLCYGNVEKNDGQ